MLVTSIIALPGGKYSRSSSSSNSVSVRRVWHGPAVYSYSRPMQCNAASDAVGGRDVCACPLFNTMTRSNISMHNRVNSTCHSFTNKHDGAWVVRVFRLMRRENSTCRYFAHLPCRFAVFLHCLRLSVCLSVVPLESISRWLFVYKSDHRKKEVASQS